ncbi:MAG: NAD(P)H-dependent flavin oxidoreductase [Solirubrobacteraceae bacterium]|jgi:nitronate monooxygenase
MNFPALRHPIVQAPLAGGPSTPELAAAVSEAGGLGMLAAGYLPAERVAADLQQARELTSAALGVNVFYLTDAAVDAEAVAEYARRIEPTAAEHGVELGSPRFEDDHFQDKLELLVAERPTVVSFTFGCPSPDVVARLRDVSVGVWVTVTDVAEAEQAASVGADALVVQGVEAGGHRATFVDRDGVGELGLLPLLRLVARETDLPLVGAGGIADGHGVAAVLAAGAVAAQIGSALMRTPEAATSAPHREALARGSGRTRVTRAFTGRRARGIVNRFMDEHDQAAPAAYPHVNHMTAPLRAAARKAGDAEVINLWAGEAYALAEETPAGELVERWSSEARQALETARGRLG